METMSKFKALKGTVKMKIAWNKKIQEMSITTRICMWILLLVWISLIKGSQISEVWQEMSNEEQQYVSEGLVLLILIDVSLEFWRYGLRQFANKRFGAIIVGSLLYGVFCLGVGFLPSVVVGEKGEDGHVIKDLAAYGFNECFYIISFLLVIAIFISYFKKKNGVIKKTFRNYWGDLIKKLPSAISVFSIITVFYFCLTMFLFSTMRLENAMYGWLFSYLNVVCVIFYYVLCEDEEKEEILSSKEDVQRAITDNVIKRLFG